MGWLLVLLATAMLAGCASFPTSGPVERVSDAGQGRPPGIDVAAQPPQPGASPEAILEGFFSASESPGEGYMVARQYLTPSAAGAWRPETGIAVYDATGQSRVVTADGAAELRAPLVGRVDVDHVFTAVHVPDFSHNFHMTKVDGEWRIGNPGNGILMSLQRFHRAFASVPVYYLDAAGERMVSHPVFLRQTDVSPQTPDVLVRAVIGGPGTWLRPVMTDMLPAEVASSGTWIDENGVAHISLSQEIEALSAEQRVLAAAQLLYTLSYFDSVTGVQITVNGRPLSISVADADGTVGFDAVAYLAADRPQVPRDLFGVTGNSIIRISEAPEWTPTALPGVLGGDWEVTPGRIAASWAGDRVGVVSADQHQLYAVAVPSGNPTLAFEGTQLVKPQFDALGQLWTVDNTPGGPVLVRLGVDGRLILLPVPELASAQVVGFRISPDMTRMAVIAQFGSVQRLGMLRLRGAEQLIVDGWRELPLNTSRGQLQAFRDVAFVSPERMLVLGASQRDPQFSVYSLDVDGAQVTSQGPISDVDAISLTAMPIGTVGAVAVVSATGRGLRFEAQYRWPTFIEDVSDLAYPS